MEFNNVYITDLNWELSQLDWFSLCENANDIDETYSCWYSYFRSVVEKYIPVKRVTICPNDKPGMDSKVRLAIRRRDRLLRIHNLRPSLVTWESCRAQRNIVTSLIRFAKKSFYERAYKELSNQISTVRSGGQSLIGYVAEKILHLFHPLWTSSCQCHSSCYPALSTQRLLSSIIATEEQVLELMKSVDSMMELVIRLLSYAARVFMFISYFTHFINLSLSLGQHPSEWKLQMLFLYLKMTTVN